MNAAPPPDVRQGQWATYDGSDRLGSRGTDATPARWCQLILIMASVRCKRSPGSTAVFKNFLLFIIGVFVSCSCCFSKWKCWPNNSFFCGSFSLWCFEKTGSLNAPGWSFQRLRTDEAIPVLRNVGSVSNISLSTSKTPGTVSLFFSRLDQPVDVARPLGTALNHWLSALVCKMFKEGERHHLQKILWTF